MNAPVETRPARDTDLPFVIQTWLRSNRRGPFGSGLTEREYYDTHDPLVRRLLKEETTVIAHPPDSDDEIMGYVCFGDKAIHFIYVKSLYRRLGVGWELLDATGRKRDEVIPVTTAPPHFISKWLEDKVRISNNPYLLGRT